ncbi:MAG TPA: YbaK/EbsC family protein, partial [Deltaproteobacteria bacterium]|nr:YbaK/EbsC family protein [Deltaproteobacteria bacterium]
ALGAVPPLGAAYGLPTVLDSSLENRSEVFFEAGDHETLVRMEGDEFRGLLASAAVADIASELPGLALALEAKERLYDSLHAVRRAIGAPIANRERWRKRLHRALTRLARATDEHVAETEAPTGLLSEIVSEAPRLWRQVEGLKAEHATLVGECDRLISRLESDDSPRLLRRQTNLLLDRFERHRHRGADLVYEAFDVDIGGG